VKKSRKIAEGLPHVVDQAETVIFLDFAGMQCPVFLRGNDYLQGKTNFSKTQSAFSLP
tara:strand:- start:4260 stop:4433 length:174 start_codon:yes stop_codon:yes gene_type:complete